MSAKTHSYAVHLSFGGETVEYVEADTEDEAIERALSSWSDKDVEVEIDRVADEGEL